MSKDAEHYGLIHCDAHYKNFFYDQGQLTFFDFDDCCYQWFVYDVATILFGVVLMEDVENTGEAQEKVALDFLPAFFEGYRQSRIENGEAYLNLDFRQFSFR